MCMCYCKCSFDIGAVQFLTSVLPGIVNAAVGAFAPQPTAQAPVPQAVQATASQATANWSSQGSLPESGLLYSHPPRAQGGAPAGLRASTNSSGMPGAPQPRRVIVHRVVRPNTAGGSAGAEDQPSHVSGRPAYAGVFRIPNPSGGPPHQPNHSPSAAAAAETASEQGGNNNSRGSEARSSGTADHEASDPVGTVD